MSTGRPIANELRTPILERLGFLSLSPLQVGLTWLGQASFALRALGQIVLIDPFLSEYRGRRFPPPFGPSAAQGISLTLVTHNHVDHLDGEALKGIAAASPESRFVVPAPVTATVSDLGIDMDRVIGAQPGGELRFGDLVVRPVPAMHGMDATAPYTFGGELSSGQYAFLGYVIDTGELRVYHAGDTIPYDGMVDWLRPLHVDLGLLPINGRDAEREARGIVGNMDHVEAAHLGAAVGLDTLIPMHFDMFARNPGYPEKLVQTVIDENLDLGVVLPRRNKLFIYTKPGARVGL